MKSLDFDDLPYESRLPGKLLKQWAAKTPDRPYMTIAGRTCTFAQTDAHCRAVARGLAQRGLSEGKRLMLLLPNCVEFVFSWFASSMLGAVTIPVNITLKGPLLDYTIKDCRPDGLIVHHSLLANLDTLSAEARALLPWIAVVGNAQEPLPTSAFAFDSLYVREGADPEIPGDFRRIQMISYTSGTTGPSKGVISSNSATFCSGHNFIKVMGMQQDDILYAPLPLFHGMSSRQGILPTLVTGAHIVIDEHFSASRYFQRATEVDATLGMVVHALIPLLKVQPPGEFDRRHRIRAMFNTRHDREFEERFGVHMVEAFAMTEISHVLNTPYPQRKWGSTGLAHPDWEVRLVDAEDFPVAVGQPGELLVRPRKPYIMMDGYLNKPELTLHAWRNGWFHTGDMMYQDEEGYFFYLDRDKDRIRRRGENVSSAEVEMCVCAHPAVAEAAALPHPAGDGEDEIRIAVVLNGNAAVTQRELWEWLRERMPKFMLPRFVEFVAELPRTATSKVNKHQLVKDGLGSGAWDSLADSTGAPQ